ncbi:MAG: biotin--[acetyl-CoA-carboxylase] ligase [Prevotella sp.]|nr:biotin--[acetyl-CoA-carboxylase] ligase [Prevotella sp.]
MNKEKDVFLQLAKVSCMQHIRLIHLEETSSTNDYLCHYKGEEGTLLTVVTTDYQSSGRGQGSNSWESERGANLLFSMLIHPTTLPAAQQFQLSMAISLSIVRVLQHLSPHFSIKWPNDIYWNDRKIGGILIEHQLSGTTIRQSILGIGINVNQSLFVSDAPNPVSLLQILGQPVDRDALLQAILRQWEEVGNWSAQEIHDTYLKHLYRKSGYHPYQDHQGPFMARIDTVEKDGHLVLCDEEGQLRRYAFKEVKTVISS